MSLRPVKKDGNGDEYYTPKYVVEILLPYLKETDIKTIWCPCDKETSEYVIVLKEHGYNVIATHIDNGENILTYTPKEPFDAVITNPPFSIKNEIINKLNNLGKPFALLLSATCVQSASLIKLISETKRFYFVMFDKRISYDGDRPPFPSWYFTGNFLNKNEFYIYKEKPIKLFKEWENKTINKIETQMKMNF